MPEKILHYLSNNTGAYLLAIREHLVISLLALCAAILIGVPLGVLCVKYKSRQKWIVGVFQVLRIVPSLAVLVMLIPIMGTGERPAITALVLLAVPPVLMNTVAGLEEVPFFMLETAEGMGMTQPQLWIKVRLPLALPLILAGIKIAMIEIIASATIAAKIGAGGLGGIILTGLGLNRTDLLLIGGVTVALLSITAGVLMDLLDRALLKYKYAGKKEFRMKTNLRKTAAVMLALVFVLSFAACGSPAPKAEDITIRIGSKDFTESMVVTEIYALALEGAGFKVERVPAIAGSLIHAAIVNKEIDIYPEYTGTGLLSILQMDLITDPQEVYDTVKTEYEKQFKITWLDLSTANDGQGLVIRTEVSKNLGITTISDLQKHATELRFCSQGEFDERPDGLPALIEKYGPFDWKSSRVYDNGIKYEVLSSNEADVSPAYTTEGALVNTEQFTLLEDDKQVWPPYNLVPIVRDEVLTAAPGIADALNKVSAKLNTSNLTQLNAEVDVNKREVEEVAAEFYKSIG